MVALRDTLVLTDEDADVVGEDDADMVTEVVPVDEAEIDTVDV